MSLITYEAIREAQRAEQAEQLQRLPEGFFDAIKNWIDYKKSKDDDLSLREIDSAKKLIEDIISRRQRKLLVYAIGTVRGDLPPEGLDRDEEEFSDTCVSLIKEFRSRLSDRILTDDGMVQKRLSEVSEIIGEIGKRKEVIEVPDDQQPTETVVQEPTVTEPVVQETQSNNMLLSSDRTEPVEQPRMESDSNLLMGGPKSDSTQEEEPKKGLKLLVDLPKFVGGDLNSYGPFNAGEIITVPDDIKKLLLMRKVVEEIV